MCCWDSSFLVTVLRVCNGPFPWPWCGVLGKGRGSVWPVALLDPSWLEASCYSSLLYGHTPPQTQSKADPAFLQIQAVSGMGAGEGCWLHAKRFLCSPRSVVSCVSRVPPPPQSLPLTQHSDGPWGGRAQLSINKEKLKHLPG